MIRKLYQFMAVALLCCAAPLFGWSWLEQIQNQSKYNVRIKNDSDHGKNYVKIVNPNNTVPVVGNMYQNSFLLTPGAQTVKMDGFAIAPSAGNQRVYIMVDDHSSHELQELSDSDQVQIDGNTQLTAPGGQFKLIIKNANDVGDVERKNPLSLFDGDIFIALERIENKKWWEPKKLDTDENQVAAQDFIKNFGNRGFGSKK